MVVGDRLLWQRFEGVKNGARGGCGGEGEGEELGRLWERLG